MSATPRKRGKGSAAERALKAVRASAGLADKTVGADPRTGFKSTQQLAEENRQVCNKHTPEERAANIARGMELINGGAPLSSAEQVIAWRKGKAQERDGVVSKAVREALDPLADYVGSDDPLYCGVVRDKMIERVMVAIKPYLR